MRKTVYSLLASAFIVSAAGLAAVAQEDVVQHGAQVFMDVGCWQCHGTVGQGGAGPALLPNLHPEEVLATFVRQGTIGGMPPYTHAVLSNEDLHAIYAYLKSLPAPGTPELLQGE